MKILAIDTSSKLCGVCILEDDKEIYKQDLITDRSHSIKLMPIIQEVFEHTQLSLKDIDLIVCDKGPGSFTGIRIGTATAKAFSDSLDIPIVGVTSLEALAYQYINEEKIVCSILDAKHDNCYIACYKFINNAINVLLEPSALTIEEALLNLKEYENITFIGDGAVQFKDKILNNLSNCEFASDNQNNLNSYLLGLAGYNKYKSNILEDCLPLYLKAPQAQRELESKK